MYKKLENLPPLVRDLLVDFIGCLCASIGLYNFASPSGFLPGGISGIALIIQHYIPVLPLGILNLLLNIPLVIFAFFFLGRNFLLRSMRTVVVLTFTLDILAPLIPTYSRNPLLSAIFGGCFVGLGLGIIFSNHSSTGGVDLIVMSLKKLKPHLSLGTITMMRFCLWERRSGPARRYLYLLCDPSHGRLHIWRSSRQAGHDYYGPRQGLRLRD